MAQIDPSIALQFKQPQFQDPINQFAKAQELNVNALKMNEMQRGLESQNKLRQLFSQGVDVSTPEGFKQLAGVDPTTALKLRTEALQGRKLQAETGAAEFKLDKDKIDRAITDIANFSTAQDAFKDIQRRVQAGELPADKAQFLVNQLNSMPYEKFQMAQLRNLLGAKDRITTDEQARSNKVKEGIQQGQLDVSKSNLTIAQQNQQRGTIPAGYRMTKEGTLEAIPGGPTTTNLSPKEIQLREAKFPQAKLAVETFESKTDELKKDLIALRNHPGLASITGIVAGRAPGLTKDGRAAQVLYDRILARGGFKELQDMRAASTTGGALGNVSNQEGQFLRQAFSGIDRVQDKSDVQSAIDSTINGLDGAKNRVREAYDMTYDYKGGGATPPPAPPPPPPPGSSANTVTIPSGKVLTFPTPEAAAAYRQAAGL
jgi:hypothetical protein